MTGRGTNAGSVVSSRRFVETDPERDDDSPPPAPFSPAEVESCVRVLRHLATERLHLDAIPPELRRELLVAAGQVSRPSRDELVRAAKILRRQKRAERRHHDAQLFATAEIRTAQRSSVFVPPELRLTAGESAESLGPELLEPRKCYVCKALFRRVHFYYDSMCPPCAELNYQKRSRGVFARAGRAHHRGAAQDRLQASLMMLRAGARVIATTRFPNDSAARYAREPDYASLRDRSQIHGLDLVTRRASRSSRDYLNRHVRTARSPDQQRGADGAPTARVLRATSWPGKSARRPPVSRTRARSSRLRACARI